MKYFFAVATIFLFASCDYSLEFTAKQDDAYIIEKDNHNSVKSFKGFEGTTLTFEAQFDETAIYKTKSPSNQADINKLLGFSDCGVEHHANSARIGWRWYNDRLEVLAYVYNKGTRITKYIASVPLNQFVLYEISRTNTGYRFTVADTVVHIPAAFEECTGGGNYYLWPYFGGNETAPHTISILIQQLNENNI